MGSPPPTPRAYSTRSNNDSSSTDGHYVVIDPAALESSVRFYRSQLAGQGPLQLAETLRTAMTVDASFGSIPNADHARAQLTDFIVDHIGVMQKMGVSLEDFVARVQAAAHLGYETDPATRAEARTAALNQQSIVHRRVS